MNTYEVSTQHAGGAFGDAFIVAVQIAADSPVEAAEMRFDVLSEREKTTTTALLVQGGGRAHVFVVKAEVVRKVVPA